MNIEQLTEEEISRRGALLGKILGLKKQSSGNKWWLTDWGTKTDRGLFLMIARIVEDGE